MGDHARDDESGVTLPMAPSEAEWARMTALDRMRVAASLPADLGLLPSEGTPHSNAIRRVHNVLDDHFSRRGRAVFIAENLAVYYPAEPVFAPDILAVVDVGLHDRMKWLVSEEGRGLDLALEVLVSGDRRKDLELNVERYAQLGIREYFVFDYTRVRLLGYRLAGGRRYESIVPQFGMLRSEVLGLELRVQGGRLRFYNGPEMLAEADERIAVLEQMLASVDERLRDEAAQREREARTLAEAEAKLAEALAEIERLRGQTT
ncbi:MAG: Uma2 family endonuclease [Myxococcales bacterium]|nr:Uma2 family endonuclease [Myxococcales bacterium]